MRVHRLRRALAKLLGEPALHVGVDDACQSLFAHHLDAVVPAGLVGKIAGGVGQDELVDAVRRVGAEPLADHAAHRQAAPIDLRDAEAVEDRKHVAAEPLHRIGALRHAGFAVAAPVVAQQAEVLGERRHLLVPHVQSGAERIRQHQHRSALPALPARHGSMQPSSVLMSGIDLSSLRSRRNLVAAPLAPRQPLLPHGLSRRRRSRRPKRVCRRKGPTAVSRKVSGQGDVAKE